MSKQDWPDSKWQWAMGSVLVPLVMLYVAATWDQGSAYVKDQETRQDHEISEIRIENSKQTDRLGELAKLNAETAARLEALGDKQNELSDRLRQHELEVAREYMNSLHENSQGSRRGKQ